MKPMGTAEAVLLVGQLICGLVSMIGFTLTVYLDANIFMLMGWIPVLYMFILGHAGSKIYKARQ